MSIASMQAEKVAQAIWTAGNTTLTFIYDETVYNEGDTFNGEIVTNVWKGVDLNKTLAEQYVYKWNKALQESITKAVFKESFKDFAPTNTSYWFYNCEKLIEIEGLEFLNTMNVTDMSNMFDNCTSLTSLDLSHFDTGKVTDMSYMFYYCNDLASLDVSSFDTEKVTNMTWMFGSCWALTSLDLSNFNTRNVTNMDYMFSYSSVLNLSLGNGFTTERVKTSYSSVFTSYGLTIYVDAEAKASVDAALEKIRFTGAMGYTTTTDTPRTVSANGKDYWATYYNSVASMTVPEGVEAYTATVDGDALVLNKIEDGIVPKGNAVVLKSANEETVLDVCTAPRNIIDGNELQGVA